MNNDILNIAKDWTGSIMSIQDIENEYRDITPPKKGYLYQLSSKYIKNIDKVRSKYPKNHILNSDFNSNISLLTINLNIIAANNNVDPATIFLCATDKRNKKY